MPSSPSSSQNTTRRALLAGSAGVFVAAAANAQPVRRTGGRGAPNIVLMMVDNFGYGDLGCYGGGELRGVATPRIDRLAAEGVRLTNYNAEPECTPTRSALLTGRMPIRTGTSIVESRGAKDGIAPWEYTLAELLSDAGYATACYGKWHLGSGEDRAPTRQGFDEWFGIPRSSGEVNWPIQPGFDPKEYTPQSVMEGHRGEPGRPLRTYDRAARALIDREITERAEAFIRAHAGAGRPFFLYLPFTLPHEPPLAHPDFVKPGRSSYQNALAEIDHNAGRVIDAVEKAGLRDDTIVVFCSDNGPQSFQGVGVDFGGRADSGPFRGEFPSGWEGAIRTACIIRWPGRTSPGRVTNGMVSVQDFYRTFARVAGASARVPTDRAVDSIDQTDFLFGPKPTSNRDQLMIFHNNRLLAVKWKNFKMHFAVREPPRGAVVASGQVATTAYLEELPSPWVFDLENDPKELWNIYTTNIWVRRPVARIQREYEESVMRFPNVPTGGEGPVRAAAAAS